jgi:hypothetical protein
VRTIHSINMCGNRGRKWKHSIYDYTFFNNFWTELLKMHSPFDEGSWTYNAIIVLFNYLFMCIIFLCTISFFFELPYSTSKFYTDTIFAIVNI